MIKPNMELFKFDVYPTKYSRFINRIETSVEAIEDDQKP